MADIFTDIVQLEADIDQKLAALRPLLTDLRCIRDRGLVDALDILIAREACGAVYDIICLGGFKAEALYTREHCKYET